MPGGNPLIMHSLHKRPSVPMYIICVTYAEVFQDVCYICECHRCMLHIHRPTLRTSYFLSTKTQQSFLIFMVQRHSSFFNLNELQGRVIHPQALASLIILLKLVLAVKRNFSRTRLGSLCTNEELAASLLGNSTFWENLTFWFWW